MARKSLQSLIMISRVQKQQREDAVASCQQQLETKYPRTGQKKEKCSGLTTTTSNSS
jgi:hypothetical protein